LRSAERRLRGYVKRADWPLAVALCDKLLADVPRADDGRTEWRVATAELEIIRGRLHVAETRLKATLRDAGYYRPYTADEGGEPQWGIAPVCGAMARVKAELGQFRQALWWQTQADRAAETCCGNFIGSKHNWDYPLRVVWTIAQQPYGTAWTNLDPICDGNFTPLTSVDFSNLGSDGRDDLQREHAAAEARLILAELHLRNGDRERARELFARAAYDEWGVGPIARSRLRALKAAPAVRVAAFH
jgi:hypothetical protein